jgi:hypothetical protein
VRDDDQDESGQGAWNKREDRDLVARERDDEQATVDPRDVFMRDVDLPLRYPLPR